MGATLGIWEFLSQTNNSADCVPMEDCFKFVDDLTVLEIINLLNMTIEPYDIINHIPSDISTNNQFIQADQLKTQTYIEDLDKWSENQTSTQSLKAGAICFAFLCFYVFCVFT